MRPAASGVKSTLSDVFLSDTCKPGVLKIIGRRSAGDRKMMSWSIRCRMNGSCRPVHASTCVRTSATFSLAFATADYLTRKGIKLHIRAPGQHARFIVRRSALLRDQLHKIDSQLEADGLQMIPFDQRLSEAIFVGNVLLSIGGSTSYQA